MGGRRPLPAVLLLQRGGRVRGAVERAHRDGEGGNPDFAHGRAGGMETGILSRRGGTRHGGRGAPAPLRGRGRDGDVRQGREGHGRRGFHTGGGDGNVEILHLGRPEHGLVVQHLQFPDTLLVGAEGCPRRGRLRGRLRVRGHRGDAGEYHAPRQEARGGDAHGADGGQRGLGSLREGLQPGARGERGIHDAGGLPRG